MRAWWRLSQGLVKAQTEVQWLGLETLNWGAGNGSGTGRSVVQGATPAAAVKVVTAAGKLKERRQQRQSAAAETLGLRASLGGGEC